MHFFLLAIFLLSIFFKIQGNDDYQPFFTIPNRCNIIAFSPDGKYLVVDRPNGFVVYAEDIANNQFNEVSNITLISNPSRFHISNDGTIIVVHVGIQKQFFVKTAGNTYPASYNYRFYKGG